jgi:hypothetical protein
MEQEQLDAFRQTLISLRYEIEQLNITSKEAALSQINQRERRRVVTGAW